ncbi:hypothetical protein M569_00160 [Genlisea aurea]|uniref:Choline transporter-like protein n=1 Tax=Genlisea aurea TaxID=192259 RepID=S8D4B8_9LAMI|nr:hypothetical protein M569_00160 [Genlisea aurea]
MTAAVFLSARTAFIFGQLGEANLNSHFLVEFVGGLMSNSPFSSSSVSSYDSALGPSQASMVGIHLTSQRPSPTTSRRWRDVFWLLIYLLHLILVGFALVVFGVNRFRKPDRLNISKYTMGFLQDKSGLTEEYWPFYGVAGGVGAFLGCTWLLLLCSSAIQILKLSVHLLTTYLAVVSVLCFWAKQFFWGVAFASAASLQFLYVISVIDRLPFTMLVLQRAVQMVWKLPELLRAASLFILLMLLWLSLWSFGVAGILAMGIGISGSWWLLLAFSVSLFWTGAVLCNIVHAVVSGVVFLILIHSGGEASAMPPKPVFESFRHAVTTSFGSICYGSLFTAAIRTMRWKIRGLRSKIGGNECLLCCVDFLFHMVEFLVRWFNKYAYVQIALYGKNFNHSAKDAWELFQSTGVEALVAYDCTGAVLFMGTVLGGLVSGTCAAVWTRFKHPERVAMVGSTSMLMGMILVGLAMVMVESAVTSIYVCFAEDPALIDRWDAAFFAQLSEKLQQRLQHRSARCRSAVATHRIGEQIEAAAIATAV